MKTTDNSFADLNILIVDDNPSNIQVLGNTLKRNNLNFEFALSGSAAISWLRKKAFHLILLDVMMPDLDGFQTLEQIRKNDNWNDISIIFLTAKSDLKTLVRGFDHGVQDYLTKPFNPQELVSRVRAHLATSAHQKLLKSFNEQLELQVFERTAALVRSEQKLKEANTSLSNLISNIPSVVFKCDADKDLTMRYLSPQFFELTGYPVEEMLGKKGKPIVDLLPERDRIRFEEAMPPQQEGTFHTKTKLITAGGDVLWVAIQGNFRVAEGQGTIEGVIHDISQQVALEELLMTNATQAADKERDAIAKELHDGVQQYLASVSMALQGIPEAHVAEASRARFAENLQRLNELSREIRTISHRLVPKSVEDFGLSPTLKDLIARQKEYAAIDISIEENIKNQRFLPEVEINVFRIVQEAMNNATKYAKPTAVRIQLFVRDNILTLMIEDDGTGFDQTDINYRKKGFGLLSMESRAASIGGFFEINSSEKNGTQIMVEIPINS